MQYLTIVQQKANQVWSFTTSMSSLLFVMSCLFNKCSRFSSLFNTKKAPWKLARCHQVTSVISKFSGGVPPDTLNKGEAPPLMSHARPVQPFRLPGGLQPHFPRALIVSWGKPCRTDRWVVMGPGGLTGECWWGQELHWPNCNIFLPLVLGKCPFSFWDLALQPFIATALSGISSLKYLLQWILLCEFATVACCRCWHQDWPHFVPCWPPGGPGAGCSGSLACHLCGAGNILLLAA